MNISIIIPTYNRARYIAKTLESFVSQNYLGGESEMIVVDNNSTDDTARAVAGFIREHPWARVSCLLEKRQGVHYARNTGAKAARHELLYFTDDDMVADKQLLSEIVKPFLEDPLVATATGRVLPLWESEPPKWVLRHCYNQLLSILDPAEESFITRSIRYLYSCHQAVRREVFFSAEGFNPENTKGVWIGDGETGLNKKILEKGLKFAYNGKSVIYHMIPASRMTQGYLNRRIGNSAYCHAYTDYRDKKPSPPGLLADCFAQLLVRGPLHMAYFALKAVYKLDPHLLRFSLAYGFYYVNRVRYNLRLAFSAKWRRFVLKNDWLTNDNEFYDQL